MNAPEENRAGPVLAICGGVGGAKLALGLYNVLGPDRLTVVVNTGDDFEHLGFHISPDLDTVTYTLAGLANPETGWGRADETWSFMAALEALGGEGWFRLGDSDLATHVERTRRLRAGEPLSRIAMDFTARLGIRARIVPMSDDPVRTVVHTQGGDLPFQHYFVKLRCVPAVTGFSFVGAATAKPHPMFLSTLRAADLDLVVICPSNPYLSVDPILALPGVRQALDDCAGPVVAVSPIVGGQTIKGPAAKIMAELDISPTAAAVARHYDGLLDGFVLDAVDTGQAAAIALPTLATDTVMRSLADREALARKILAFAAELRCRSLAARSAG
ncbi:MAG TPA: 2-phospho-L-lactate transferase [Alphaproteobacteria bacterium]|nr:2-phospho-L-lactate transferase [Alphaproteobacteria bacterium]